MFYFGKLVFLKWFGLRGVDFIAIYSSRREVELILRFFIASLLIMENFNYITKPVQFLQAVLQLEGAKRCSNYFKILF